MSNSHHNDLLRDSRLENLVFKNLSKRLYKIILPKIHRLFKNNYPYREIETECLKVAERIILIWITELNNSLSSKTQIPLNDLYLPVFNYGVKSSLRNVLVFNQKRDFLQLFEHFIKEYMMGKKKQKLPLSMRILKHESDSHFLSEIYLLERIQP